MDLSGRLARTATRGVALLVVEVPGWGRLRCAVQSELRARGWREATSAAEADGLVVCGRPGVELDRCVELVWQQLPGPRARAPVTTETAVGAALDQLLADLVDTGRQRVDAVERPASNEPEQDRTDHGDGHDDGDGDGDGDGEEHASSSDHGGHEGMDAGGMDMPSPGGIPLAGGGPDRDGLDLDQLHVPLGPVLPAWPAGLVVECTVQGDLVTAANARVLPGGAPLPAGVDLVHGSPPDRLDRVARMLAVGGWDDAATAAARLRDRLLSGSAADDVRPDVERLARRVRRSRVLRWSLADLPGVRDRLLGWLDEARDGLAGAPTPVTGTPVESLGHMLPGRDLAAARLLVAAADVDTAGLVRSGADLS